MDSINMNLLNLSNLSLRHNLAEERVNMDNFVTIINHLSPANPPYPPPPALYINLNFVKLSLKVNMNAIFQ